MEGDNADVSLNNFHDTTGAAVIANNAPDPMQTHIHDNTVSSSEGGGIFCTCRNGLVESNTVGPVASNSYGISLQGGHDTEVFGNTLTGANIDLLDSGTAHLLNNHVDGQGANSTLYTFKAGLRTSTWSIWRTRMRRG